MGELLLVRADASAEIGVGHLMRCLALGQAWAEAGGRVLFLTVDPAPAIVERMRREGCEVESPEAPPGSLKDAEATARRAAVLGAEWVAADGYHFDTDFQRRLRGGGVRLLWIDDEAHAAPYCADLILNQNLHAGPELYRRRAPESELLLGPRYALLRRELRGAAAAPVDSSGGGVRVLVTLGGGASPAAAAEVMAALAELTGLDLRVRWVVGPLDERPAALPAAAGAPRIEWVRSPASMAPLMAWADLAVAAGGSTCWELLHLGVPTVVTVLYDNQEPIARSLAAGRAAVDLGRIDDGYRRRLCEAVGALAADPARRASLARRGRRLVDGRGAERVRDRLLSIAASALPGDGL